MPTPGRRFRSRNRCLAAPPPRTSGCRLLTSAGVRGDGGRLRLRSRRLELLRGWWPAGRRLERRPGRGLERRRARGLVARRRRLRASQSTVGALRLGAGDSEAAPRALVHGYPCTRTAMVERCRRGARSGYRGSRRTSTAPVRLLPGPRRGARGSSLVGRCRSTPRVRDRAALSPLVVTGSRGRRSRRTTAAPARHAAVAGAAVGPSCGSAERARRAHSRSLRRRCSAGPLSLPAQTDRAWVPASNVGGWMLATAVVGRPGPLTSPLARIPRVRAPGMSGTGSRLTGAVSCTADRTPSRMRQIAPAHHCRSPMSLRVRGGRRPFTAHFEPRPPPGWGSRAPRRVALR